MANSVAVLFVHGINVREQDFSKDMQKILKDRIHDSIDVKYASVFWGDIVRTRQDAFLHKAEKECGIGDSTFRRFIVQGLGDAAAYQKTRQRKDSAYYEIQAKVRRQINELATPGEPNRPLVVIAHSLGCHIMSSYAWDLNKLKQQPSGSLSEEEQQILDEARTPFHRLDTFAGFVTMGSNMPLFTFMFDPDNVFPITSARPGLQPAFPGKALDDDTKSKARWLNFYSRNDLLGYPLEPLYAVNRCNGLLTDRHVYAEGWLCSRLVPSPLDALAAHSGYWTNDTVIDETVRLIEDISGYEKKSWFGRLFQRRPNNLSMSANLSST